MPAQYDPRSEEEIQAANNAQAAIQRPAGSGPAMTAAQAAEQARQNGQRAIQNPDGTFKFVPLSGAEAANNKLSVGAGAISNDIDARAAQSQAGFQSGVAGLGLSPQGPGPSQVDVFNQSAAGVGGFNGGVARSTFNSAPQIAPGQGRAPPPGTMPTLSNVPGSAGNGPPSAVEQAAGNASAALGPAPQVDQGLADRQLGAYQESLGMSREVIDRLLNGPSTTEKIGARMLENQLAIARSARGGPGAVQQALSQAQQAAPELQAQASQQAANEELQRTTAAGQVASNFAQAALGARGQDIDVAKSNQQASTAVMGYISSLTGTQMELDQRDQELMGQMIRDMAVQDFNWASLNAAQEQAALANYLQVYGISANAQAQINAIKQQQKFTLKDMVNAGVGLVTGGATIAAAGAGK